jgi:hypothetical protein
VKLGTHRSQWVQCLGNVTVLMESNLRANPQWLVIPVWPPTLSELQKPLCEKTALMRGKEVSKQYMNRPPALTIPLLGILPRDVLTRAN